MDERPGRIYSPDPGGVSKNARNGGHDSSSGPGAGHATLPTWHPRERDRKRVRAGGGAAPDASRRCSAIRHDSFTGLFPTRD